MTIEYKDSKRIVALSTDVVETLDYSDDFSSDGYTDVGSNVGVSSGKMKFTNTAGGDNRSHKSLGITLDSNFISRFEYKRLSTTSGNIPTYPVVFTATNSDPEADNDFIAIRVDSGGTAYLTVDDGTTNTVTSGITISNDVNYFIELKREGTTSYLSIKTGSHTGSDISGSPVNLSTPATVTGLTTVQHAVKSNQTGGSYNAEIDNLEIYNGETSLTSKPTNVQDNSLLVEKDTARRYWFSADNSGFPTNSSNYPDGNNGTAPSRIDIPTTGLTSLTNGSVAFWVYPLEAATDVADFVVLSGSDSGAASTEMIFGFIGNTSKVGIHARSGGSWILKLNAGSLPKSQWSHVVYTNNTSSGNKVYVNGAEVTPSYTNGSASSNVFFNNVTTNTFTIGANKDSGGYQWGMEGNVQQVLIYNTTLSASDVTTLYNSGNYNSSPSSTGLLRRYELTSDVNDSSGNSQNGTATSISFTSVDSPTPATWTMQPTYQTDFSSSTGWTQTGSNITISTGTNSLTWIGDRTTSSHGLHYDIGANRVSSKWILEFDFVLDNYSAGTASFTHQIGVMLTDVNSTSGTYGSDATRNFVGMRLNWRTDTASQQRKFYVIDDNAGTDTWADNAPANTPDDSTAQSFPTAGTTYHMKLIKDGSSHSLEIWNSSQSSLLDTLNGSNSTTADIRYILVQSYNVAADGNPSFDGKIQNMKFYNGVTSIN